MEKIDSLTEEQKALFPVYLERFIKIGHDTHTDREKAEAAVKLAYDKVGVPFPDKIIWFDSPLGQALGYSIFDKIIKDPKALASVSASVRDSVSASVRDSVSASVWDSVRDSVSASVWDSVSASVRDSVTASVRDSVSASVRASVRDSVSASVWDSVSASVRDSVSASVRDSVSASVWDSVNKWFCNIYEGQHIAGTGSYVAYFSEILGLELSVFDGMQSMIRECGWVYLGKNVVLMSPKPSVCKTRKNDRGHYVLHAEGEPAIRYEDGFEIYAYEGVRLPEKYGKILPTQWDPKWIVEEQNADIRTKLLKGIGYERFLQAVAATTLSKQEIFGLPYELLECHLDLVGRMKFLRMKNPSVPGVYHVEPVAPHDWIRTCEDALNWRFGAEAPSDKYNVVWGK